MPEKKISFKKNRKGEPIYVYLTTRAYRNKAGKPTSDEVCIGKRDFKTNMLIPNKNYYKYFSEQKSPIYSLNTSIGSTFALEKMSINIGLRDVLEQIFPDSTQELLSLAYYVLHEGNVMMNYPYFHQEHLQHTSKLSAAAISQLFKEISEDQVNEFFKAWITKNTSDNYIAFDVSSFSTYSRQIDEAQMGYNRDKEYLPQINFGLYSTYQNAVPLAYHLYQGSITDKVFFHHLLTYDNFIPSGRLRFVLDQGFVTKDNLTFMSEKGHKYVSFLSFTLNYTNEKIKEYMADVQKVGNRIDSYNLYGLKQAEKFEGQKVYLHLYYDSQKKADQERKLFGKVKEAQEALEKLSKKNNKIPSKITKYFEVSWSEEEPSIINFEEKMDKIQEELDMKGYFILITNDDSLSSEEVIGLYRQKDHVEKHFDNIKNELDSQRLRVHSTESLEGKMFITFLALIFKNYIQKQLKNSDDKLSRLTVKEVLKELSLIRLVEDSNKERLSSPITAKQRKILSALEVDTTSLYG